jgi:hypothetical protein
MSSVKDIFTKLKTSIVGTKTVSIDTSLDNAIKDVSSFRNQSGQLGYIELLKSLISKQSDFNLGSQKFMQHGGAPSPAMYGQANRLMRYKSYHAIFSNISYAFRALTVLVDNIISPDDITKQSLDIKPKSYLESEIETESKTELVKEVVKHTKLEQNIDLIVKNVLAFGDFFVEIGTAKTALISRAYLVESYDNESIKSEAVDILNIKDNENNVKIMMDYSSFNEASNDSKNEQIDIHDIKLMMHDPRNVIKLQSEMFPICFGYLVFPKYATSHSNQLSDQAINDICISILKNLEQRIPDMKEFRDNKELKDIIATIARGTEYGLGRNVQIRFVPADKMQHFRIPSTKYYPYGESIIDPVVFLGKVLIALETALTIQRLSRSTEKIKIGVEIGLPRDAKKIIEGMKEQLRKRKISIDSFGTVDTIPSMITTFEDIYVPQKDGKPFVDISSFNEGRVDIRSKVDELKFVRDSLVAALGVPPPLIAIEENASMKATLAEENILFARTIVSHQKYLTHQMNDLIQKIFQLIDPESSLTLLDNVSIAFPTPKSLQFELMSRRMNDTINLIESLERIGIPKEYSKKKYLQDIDWNEVDNFQIDSDIEKKLGIAPPEEIGFAGGFAIGGAQGMPGAVPPPQGAY